MISKPNPSQPTLPLGAARWRAFRGLSYGRAAWLLVVLLLFWISVDQVWRTLGFRVDDAYITFSFSKNLAAGHGPVFSHGLRVEGYSNFLWMVVVAIAYLFSGEGDPLGFARVVAFGCLVAILVLVYRLTRSAAGMIAALVSVTLLVACSDLFRAAASGLETVPFAAAISFGWWVYLRESPARRRWSLLAFIPAALLRIDGFVPALVVMGVEVLSALVERRFSWRKLARWAAPALGIWGAYFAWRYWYYGLPLPAPYYAKAWVTRGDPDRGVRQAYDLIRDYGLLALLPLGVIPLVWGPRREAAYLGLAVTLQVAYAMTVGGDWMPFNRFFLPIVPLGAVLVAWGFSVCWRFASECDWPQRVLGCGLLLAAVLFSCVHMHAQWLDSPEEAEKMANARHVGSHTRDNLLANKDLMAFVVRRPGDRLATDYAGVFSVFTDAEVIDMWGLCNADIALHGSTMGVNPIYGKECAACYARLAPDYFHVGIPIVRGENAYHDQAGVLANIFQGFAIDHVISIRKNFAAGRVVEETSGRTLWFLERRRPELPLRTRRPAPGIRVDYPFEDQRGAP